MLKEIKMNENNDKINLNNRYKIKERWRITLIYPTVKWTARLGMFARDPNFSRTLCCLSAAFVGHCRLFPNTFLPEEQMHYETYPMYHVQREYSPVTLFKGIFKMGCITAQGARFYILDCHSPPYILKEVAYVEDVERKPGRYSQNRGPTQTSNSKDIRLRQIVSYSDSDHKSSSDMLNQMQELVPNLDMEE